MSASNRAALWDQSPPLTADEFAPDLPDHEVIIYRNSAHVSELYPKGFECVITIPRSKIKAQAPPPFWRHGQVMHVRTAAPRDTRDFSLQPRGIPR